MRGLRYGGLLASFALILVATLGWSAKVAAEVPVPRLEARVTDLTGTLSAEQKSTLDDGLRVIEQSSGAQLAVLLVPSTSPESIEQYSMRVVDQWKLGSKAKDDGVLLLVAKNDRKLRIEVGYGLEGVIPDAVAKRVIDETIAPLFKQGDFPGGISAGVRRLAELIEGRAAAQASVVPEEKPREDSVAAPLMLDNVRDMTGTVDEELTWQLSRRLNTFYSSGRTKPVFILIVPSTGAESLAEYSQRVLLSWGEGDQLDVDRSLLMVVALDQRQAHIAAGDGLRSKMAPGAADRLAAEKLAPALKNGDVSGALEIAVSGIESMIDDAIKNKSLEERIIEHVSEFPVWLLAAGLIIGTLLRWILGPLLGGLGMGGLVGGGAWLLFGEIQTAVISGVLAFVFVLVGVSNWVAMAASGSSGSGRSSSSGGFSGGGGGFGGGGASGGW